MASTAHQHKRPLEEDLIATGPLRPTSKKRKARRGDEDEGDQFVDSKLSRKILRIGRDLHDEDESSSTQDAPSTAFASESRQTQTENEGILNDAAVEGEEATWEDDDDAEVAGDDISPHDLDLFHKFVPPGEQPSLEIPSMSPAQGDTGTNLADLILEQIAAHEAAEGHQLTQAGDGPEDREISAKVVEAYSKIGMILSRYKSGKLPKPFKIIPTLPQWEDILSLTQPDKWTPNACFEATRIFVSTNERSARTFIETVLLPRAREDIHETRKLNVHLYNALKKATFRPAAFFKGCLFPLVESGTCTLREAVILSSVIVKVSIPALHSAAALMRLTDIVAEQASASNESGGATNIFIRAFLDKKYALPYKVIDNLVFHFLRFRRTQPSETDAKDGARDAKLPVLWHQSLLAFAQRYRNDITEDQREALLDLLLVKGHKDIGPEVRRELLQGRGRGMAVPEAARGDGDDTMAVDTA